MLDVLSAFAISLILLSSTINFIESIHHLTHKEEMIFKENEAIEFIHSVGCSHLSQDRKTQLINSYIARDHYLISYHDNKLIVGGGNEQTKFIFNGF